MKPTPAKTAPLEEEPEEKSAELYYEQVNNITITCSDSATVNVHINQSGEPKNEPPRP